MSGFQMFLHKFADQMFQALIKDNRFEYLTQGLKMSIIITLIAAVIGVVLGLLLAIFKMQEKGVMFSIANTYISIIRGTPMAVQLTIIYFIILGKSGLPAIVTASVAFGMNSAAYVAEIVRAGIAAVDRGQMEAGRSLGLSYVKCMRYIIVPQAVKNVLPALGNEFIVLLKETSIAGYIGLADLNKGGLIISSLTYNGFVAPICVAYVYFLMTTVLSSGMGKLERRLRQSD